VVGELATLPKILPDFRNSLLKLLADALLIDFKNDKQELEKRRGTANRVATDLESCKLHEKFN
jgi:hypothetical protein